MNQDERDALRARVDAEPDDDRGRLARTLMAEVDRLNESINRRARADLLNSLVTGHHLSLENANRYIDTRPMPTFQMEKGPCRACDGHGSRFEPGCIGGRHTSCKRCHGRGSTTRLRLPWAPVGEPIDLFAEPEP